MNEGDFAQISCIVTSGDQPLTISWSFHGNQISADTGITTTNLGSRLSMLVIESVKHNHQGNYTCKAKNAAGVRSYTAELKVNGRLLLMDGHMKALETGHLLIFMQVLYIYFCFNRTTTNWAI